jgi:hypothetical protein
MPREPLVFAFHDDTLYAFERGDEFSGSWFGGPLDATISGLTLGPYPLHRVATLGGEHIPALKSTLENGLQIDIPLFYGLRYDGCSMHYRFRSNSDVELLHLAPTQSSVDWPYSDYPALLPYIPLRLAGEPRHERYQEFAERFWNMPEQQPAELLAAVPPPAAIGMSLWGKAGDAEEVTIVFECDLKEKLVKATNVVS